MEMEFGSIVRGNFVTRYFTRMMTSFISDPFKRMIYVSSALGALAHRNLPELEVLRELNITLRLARKTSSLMFPIYLGNLLWKDVRGKTLSLEIGSIAVQDLEIARLDDADLWRTGLFFSQNAPRWLSYGSPMLMSSDLHDALEVLIQGAD